MAKSILLSGRKKKKPVLVLKSGRSPEGAKAAMSHTGALMGSDEIYDALLKQSGAIRVDTMEELFDYATAFSKQPLPKSIILIPDLLIFLRRKLMPMKLLIHLDCIKQVLMSGPILFQLSSLKMSNCGKMFMRNGTNLFWLLLGKKRE